MSEIRTRTDHKEKHIVIFSDKDGVGFRNEDIGSIQLNDDSV